jgi:predicted nucleic acid-binding protein
MTELSYLLDTNIFSQWLKPKPLPHVIDRWEKAGDDRLAISVICEAEVLFGLELKQSANLNARYDTILKDRLKVLNVDSKVAKTYVELRSGVHRKGKPCAPFDLLIAATAKAHNLILATLNYRHFTSIEGLAVEDWSR